MKNTEVIIRFIKFLLHTSHYIKNFFCIILLKPLSNSTRGAPTSLSMKKLSESLSDLMSPAELEKQVQPEKCMLSTIMLYFFRT